MRGIYHYHVSAGADKFARARLRISAYAYRCGAEQPPPRIGRRVGIVAPLLNIFDGDQTL